MFKLSTLALAALFSLSGAANATVLSDFAKDYTGNNTNAASYTLPQADTDGITIDFKFTFTPSTSSKASNGLEDNDFLGFWFNSSNDANVGVKANCGDGKCSNDVFVRLGGINGVFMPGSDLQDGEEYRIFAYLYKSDGSAYYNNLDAWLNPSPSEMLSLTGAHVHADSTVKGAGSNKSTEITSVGFRTANLNNGVVFTVNDVNLNVDAAAVPEPGSLALMGLAMAGLGAARRRKKN